MFFLSHLIKLQKKKCQLLLRFRVQTGLFRSQKLILPSVNHRAVSWWSWSAASGASASVWEEGKSTTWACSSCAWPRTGLLSKTAGYMWDILLVCLSPQFEHTAGNFASEWAAWTNVTGRFFLYSYYSYSSHLPPGWVTFYPGGINLKF